MISTSSSKNETHVEKKTSAAGQTEQQADEPVEDAARVPRQDFHGEETRLQEGKITFIEHDERIFFK